MPPASTGSKSRVSASTVVTGQCSVRYVDHITSRASIDALAERFGARRGRHPATASTYSRIQATGIRARFSSLTSAPSTACTLPHMSRRAHEGSSPMVLPVHA